MERKNFAALCAAVLCFWLFALAFGTAQGMGLHLVARREAKTASAQAVWVEPALPAAAAPALSLNCRAAILIEQDSGRVLYEKNAEEKMPIASITKVMTLLLTFEAIHGGRLTLDTLVPVSEHAYHMGGSQIWLEPGSSSRWMRCSGPSAFPPPMTPPWRWPSWWAAASPLLWSR